MTADGQRQLPVKIGGIAIVAAPLGAPLRRVSHPLLAVSGIVPGVMAAECVATLVSLVQEA